MRRIVLVEGESDRVALETLAARTGRDLATEGAEIVVMGGVTNVRRYATTYGPRGQGLEVEGLYDSPDESIIRRGLVDAGLDVPEDLALIGFHGCEPDLEHELIRALGTDVVEQVIAAEGETRSLDLLLQMPAQRGWTRVEVLHRFIGARSGRKARYARLLVEALGEGCAPPPLRAVLGTWTPT
ncbi:hypothetical protein ASE01_17705 [Nocardioides sp. Root190]|uniref:TOPRIM nucleotidyl transferase/hydrolase domain-containing protein n=1 Tax=Nocardioides sp. Root190 TaxID=1736488 RepID=UPI0006F8CAB5|nr:TOPRIM nucleotidyl transferase/hydrolase domain-containing protein [Nocardioides sp. Root190]KRB73852.1 hypothetical protein ASE01_17705 [Nocardioides sp. Root190]